MRMLIATMMNIVVSGTGLMLLGRRWLGLALAVWYTIGIEVAVAGALIAPAVLPRSLVYGGAVVAGLAWLVAQGLFVQRCRFLLAPNLSEELAALRAHAATALNNGDSKTAYAALEIVLSVDPDDLDARLLWARVASVTGKRHSARRAWHHVRRLDSAGRYSDETETALKTLR